MFDAHTVFKKFESLNVMIIGDVMLDRYLSGQVDRISPEAPVPVVRFEAEDNRLGGAANVALNIRAMGATPLLCSVIGADQNGAHFLEILDRNDMPVEGIVQSDERMTTVKTRVLAQHQQLLRVDREDTSDLSVTETEQLLDRINHFLEHCNVDVILLQDYNKGVLTLPLIQKVLKEAKRKNIPTAVDPKKRHFLSYQLATLFKPNLKEVREGLDIEVRPERASLDQAAKKIIHHLDNQYTLITLSEKGIYCHDGQQSYLHPTQTKDIADVCGAGDTVISIAALGLAAELDLPDIAILANLAGGLVCEQVGVVPVNKKKLLERYVSRPLEAQKPDF